MIVTDDSISQTKEGAGVLIRTLKKSEKTKRPKIGDYVLVPPTIGLLCTTCYIQCLQKQMDININIMPTFSFIRYETNASWKMVKTYIRGRDILAI